MTYQHAGLLAPGDDMATMIAISHRRSEQFGLSPDSRPDFTPVSGTDLSYLVEQNRLLYSHAVPAEKFAAMLTSGQVPM